MNPLAEILQEPIPCSRRCGWETPATADADRKRAAHEHLRHDEPLPPQELTGVSWQEQAVDAIRQVAARGKDYFMYDALAEFGLADPPNAKTALGRFATLVHDMGVCHPVDYRQSHRAGTKKSAAAVWNRDGRRCVEPRCRQRAGVA